jgi:GT2 family glycosyltransferase
MPPRSLLDTALRHGLHVMVGLSAEQFVGYLIDRKKAPDIQAAVRRKVQTVAGHPALLCYAIGNEIAAPVARWLGRRRVERYLHSIYRAIKETDPGGLVTYVNYPTTEYLDLPFLDLVSFNVYLESEERLRAYLTRLQTLAGDRPLIMSEVGLDALRNGEITQAEVLDWQIRTTFAAGCAGAFVFSWTDEWHRAGAEVEDWEFGVTRRDRTPKPALAALRTAFSEAPFPPAAALPSISVVVCSCNGGRTIAECLQGISKIRYPDFEVIVVDDGSRDNTAEIAAQFEDVKLIRTPNQGLSQARNLGWQAAKGEIVAYIDDDAYPDPDWLTYLAETFRAGEYAGVGGPNLPPPGDGPIAACVANSPGGPVHVLLTDTEAEHIPGCNMAFRRSALEAVGGFDPRFRVAGDDVDICWSLEQRGWKLGFSPSALVWHHRRNSVRAYLRQQKGYGKAEALLEKKWPEKYNCAGHVAWHGRVYSAGITRVLGLTTRIYHGQWGAAPFQSLHQVGPGPLHSLLMMPEWYLVNMALTLLSALSIWWKPLLFALPLLAISAGFSFANACSSAARSRFHGEDSGFSLKILTALLHMLQPAARLYGRILHGLKLWRRRVPSGWTAPIRRQTAVWTEVWQPPEVRLKNIEASCRSKGIPIHRGGPCDDWDFEIPGGMWGGARFLMAVEDHGAGTQYVRCRITPRWSAGGLILSLLLAALATGAMSGRVWLISILFGVAALLSVLKSVRDTGGACRLILETLREQGAESPEKNPVEASAKRTMRAHA